MADGKFSRELDVAVRAVHLACSLCQKVQNTLLSTTHQQVECKDDDSLVTVAVDGRSALLHEQIIVFKPLSAGYYQSLLEAKLYPLLPKKMHIVSQSLIL